ECERVHVPQSRQLSLLQCTVIIHGFTNRPFQISHLFIEHFFLSSQSQYSLKEQRRCSRGLRRKLHLLLLQLHTTQA
ncbi:hypothetical protein PENTCL1PPCAC_5769, partial [Pristionchus entomophagus]